LDLIDEIETINKQQIVDYIYAMQLTFSQSDLLGQSGFLGSPYLGQQYLSDGTKVTTGSCDCSMIQYMQGNIAMTYSAVSALTALGDNLQRVDRAAIISGPPSPLLLSLWVTSDSTIGIKSLQEPNGSFRSTSSAGECDTRFLYCACAISSLLGIVVSPAASPDPDR
jgi:geranylgeranyl transferase type-1 subunit beta